MEAVSDLLGVQAVEPNGWMILGQPVRGRSCGSCTACCTIVPVDLASGHKASGERCQHVCSKGCRIYKDRPDPCRYWSCRFLFDEMAAGLRRPDVSGYIVDPMVDSIIQSGHVYEVAQVWIDPARHDAYRAPELRAYLEAIARRFGLAAVVRWAKPKSVVLVPPPLTPDREWWEVPVIVSDSAQAFQDQVARLGQTTYQQRQARELQREPGRP